MQGIIELDRKERRLLQELDISANRSQAFLARRTGFSRDVVALRLERLLERKVIRGFTTVLNINQLGFTGYAVYCRLESVSDQRKAKLFQALQKNSSVYWVARLAGRFDLVFGVLSASVVEFSNIYATIDSSFQLFRDVTVSTRVSVVQFGRKYLEKQHGRRAELMYNPSAPRGDLDSIDLKIVQALTADCREPTIAVARRLGISRSTLQARLKGLHERGIIQGYAALIDATAFGFHVYQLMVSFSAFSLQSKEDLLKWCRDHEYVTYLVMSIGRWSAEITLEVPNQGKLQEVLAELHAKFREILEVEIVLTFDYYAKYRIHV
jgi:Lrp/AsnC family transcriptional regulator, leucine-responsive regulatory protein